jgi:hypothetical protein
MIISYNSSFVDPEGLRQGEQGREIFMNELALKNKRTFILVLAMALVLAFTMAIPSVAWADGEDSKSTAADGLDVQIGEDGNIIIRGNEDLDFNSNDGKSAWNNIFTRYKNIIVAFSGLATLTLLGVFVFLFAKLGVTSGNEKERRSVITGILFSGIATAALGSVTVIMAFFYNALGNL